ncbi:hypothetical protein LT336_00842 [Spiroplasma sp. JKS002671]|nr:hypothetical protein [Spiroplasma sp. JKS002671]
MCAEPLFVYFSKYIQICIRSWDNNPDKCFNNIEKGRVCVAVIGAVPWPNVAAVMVRWRCLWRAMIAFLACRACRVRANSRRVMRWAVAWCCGAATMWPSRAAVRKPNWTLCVKRWLRKWAPSCLKWWAWLNVIWNRPCWPCICMAARWMAAWNRIAILICWWPWPCVWMKPPVVRWLTICWKPARARVKAKFCVRWKWPSWCMMTLFRGVIRRNVSCSLANGSVTIFWPAFLNRRPLISIWPFCWPKRVNIAWRWLVRQRKNCLIRCRNRTCLKRWTKPWPCGTARRIGRVMNATWCWPWAVFGIARWPAKLRRKMWRRIGPWNVCRRSISRWFWKRVRRIWARKKIVWPAVRISWKNLCITWKAKLPKWWVNNNCQTKFTHIYFRLI